MGEGAIVGVPTDAVPVQSGAFAECFAADGWSELSAVIVAAVLSVLVGAGVLAELFELDRAALSVHELPVLRVSADARGLLEHGVGAGVAAVGERIAGPATLIDLVFAAVSKLGALLVAKATGRGFPTTEALTAARAALATALIHLVGAAVTKLSAVVVTEAARGSGFTAAGSLTAACVLEVVGVEAALLRDETLAGTAAVVGKGAIGVATDAVLVESGILAQGFAADGRCELPGDLIATVLAIGVRVRVGAHDGELDLAA